ncbi:hypothetical protein BC834DRAFT_53504 [Gloeopeniophorella convolvens]|nr:hypothetical protein BC834DRAFT_53504 [Gloeopeniophorella convolvens]
MPCSSSFAGAVSWICLLTLRLGLGSARWCRRCHHASMCPFLPASSCYDDRQASGLRAMRFRQVLLTTNTCWQVQEDLICSLQHGRQRGRHGMVAVLSARPTYDHPACSAPQGRALPWHHTGSVNRCLVLARCYWSSSPVSARASCLPFSSGEISGLRRNKRTGMQHRYAGCLLLPANSLFSLSPP